MNSNPMTDAQAFRLMLALEAHLDTLYDESMSDEQMAGIAVKFIADRLAEHAKGKQ